MPKASSRIEYPHLGKVKFPINRRITGRGVLISIINSLADVADITESITGPRKSSLLPKGESELDKQKKELCDAIVEGANSLTTLFNQNLPHKPGLSRDLPRMFIIFPMFWRLAENFCDYRSYGTASVLH
jgi:hypothetical protein